MRFPTTFYFHDASRNRSRHYRSGVNETGRLAVVILSFIGFTLASATAALGAPSIVNLGRLPASSGTIPYKLSANGTTAVGQADTFLQRAVRWTAGTGLQEIGPSDPTLNSYATDVSANGTVVAISGYFDGGEARAFRWTAVSGPQDLGFLPGGNGAAANGVSADGSVIVGAANRAPGTGALSMRWTAATGMQSLPLAAGFNYSFATGVSALGSVIVGYNGTNNSGSRGDRAYRYTSAGGYQNLGLFSGFDRSFSNAVSGDGSTVVGGSQRFPTLTQPGASRAMRWTAATGLTPLGFPGDDSSGVSATSFDGSRIVGFSGSRAYLWTSTLGNLDLNTYLPSLGLDLTGWDLNYASGISADGNVLTGSGFYNGDQAAWVVNLVPEPASLAVVAASGTLVLRRPRPAARRSRCRGLHASRAGDRRAAMAAADQYEDWAKSQRMIQVEFVVSPPTGTREDDALFLCGREPGFGALDPAGVNLVRSPDGKYRGSVELLSGIDHFFCVTRGSYESIEADAANGQPNWRNEVIAGKDAVELTVDRWIDEPANDAEEARRVEHATMFGAARDDLNAARLDRQ